MAPRSFLVAIGLALVLGAGASQASPRVSTIAFASSRDNLAIAPAVNGGEIYLMNGDGTNPRRLTANGAYDAFPVLSPDGRGRIVFDSNRLRTASEPLNTTDLFSMSSDGSGQTLLTRGGSASWSPDGKSIAFHASASGTGLPIKPDPSAATADSDIFVLKLDGGGRTNVTHDADIDDDPDWSPVWIADRLHEASGHRQRPQLDPRRDLRHRRGGAERPHAADDERRGGAGSRVV